FAGDGGADGRAAPRHVRAVLLHSEICDDRLYVHARQLLDDLRALLHARLFPRHSLLSPQADLSAAAVQVDPDLAGLDGRGRAAGLSDGLLPGLPGDEAQDGLADPDHGAVLDQLFAARLRLEDHPRL